MPLKTPPGAYDEGEKRTCSSREGGGGKGAVRREKSCSALFCLRKGKALSRVSGEKKKKRRAEGYDHAPMGKEASLSLAQSGEMKEGEKGQSNREEEGADCRY